MKPMRWRTLLLHVVLVAGAALTLLPLVWMVSASVMPTGDANTMPPRFLPRRVTLEHYAALFTHLNLARHFANSVAITLLATWVRSSSTAWPAMRSRSCRSAAATACSEA
jgi:multiple sugar transport system permease protein